MPDRRDLRRELTRDLSSPEVVNSRQATELYEPIHTGPNNMHCLGPSTFTSRKMSDTSLGSAFRNL